MQICTANASCHKVHAAIACCSMLLIMLSFSGCGQVQTVSGVQTMPTAFHTGGQRYVIDSARSEIRLLVYRDGPLARLGHNHVITGSATGDVYVADSLADSGFRLLIPLQSFAVDLPGPRAEEGAEFAAAVSEAARAGTRHNMMGGGMLDAAQFPQIIVESVSLQGAREAPRVSALVMLHGKIQPLQFPAQVQYDAERIVITSRFSVLQSALGLRPFSILGGALRVRDELEIHIRIVALKQ